MSKALIRSEPGVDAEARILVASNPITGEELARLHILGPAEVEALVERSRLAGRSWASLSARERSRRLRRLRHLIADRSEEISEAVRAETGKALGEAIGGEALVVCDYLHYLERTAPSALAGRKAGTGSFFHRRARVSYEPYGVIGIISPWNYPFTIGMSTVATALAAGNGVVLKPSEYTPLIGVLIAELVAEATGYPDLVLAAIGEAATGEAVVRSGVDKIAFTGSVEAGRAVMKAAADSLTPVVLELGGKDAMIVCADADVERAARGAVWAAFLGCGQICQSVERVYVVESIYDQFVQAAVGQARRVKTSDEPEANIGSLIAEFQVKKVEAHVKDARDKGARILLGGRALQVPGHFFEPTVIVDVDHSMDVMKDETFGPVLPIMRVADEEEAVRLANESEYGLDASVWSRDRKKARAIADQLDVGTVLINDHLINYTISGIPFGGTRNSGFGRVHGLEGLREFARPKSWVEDRLALRNEPHWFSSQGSGEEMARALIDLRHRRGIFRRLKAGVRLLRDLIS